MAQLAPMSTAELARYLADPKDPQFSWAFYALQDRGEEAIPYLIKLMERDDLDNGWMDPMVALLKIGDKSIPPIVELLKSDNPIARRNAAWALARRNKPCKEAIVALVELLKGKDGETAGYAAAALAPDGKDASVAVPFLIPLAFRQTDSLSPDIAVEQIGLDPKLIPAVISQLTDPQDTSQPDPWHVRTDAWRIGIAVKLLQAAGTDGVPALTEALANKNTLVRLAAAETIQRLGGKAKTDPLEMALNSALSKDDTRVEAAAALVAIGAPAKAAVPGLVKDLEFGKLEVPETLELRYRCRAATVLATIPEAGSALVRGISNSNEMVRIGCMEALPNDGPTAKDAIPKIKEDLISTKSPAEQYMAVKALFRLDREWMLAAIANTQPAPSLPPWHWRELVAPAIAAAKAEGYENNK